MPVSFFRLSLLGLLAAPLLCLGATNAPSFSNEAPATNATSLAKAPDITADRMEGPDSNGWYHLDGNVRLRYADHNLRADHVDVNKGSGAVRARGHVELFRQDQGHWSGDELNYNYITKEGLSSANAAQSGRFTLLADETSRDTNGVIHMRHAQFTTCTNAPGHWHYWLTGDRIDVRLGDRISLHDAKAYFIGVPVFYAPYATRDLDHPFGPRIIPGLGNGWGAYLLTTYTYPIYTPPGPNELIGNVLLDYRTRRGLAYGHELDWSHELLGDGRFGFYMINDRNPNSSFSDTTNSVDKSRYRVYFQHEANPTPRDQVLINADYLSDEVVNHDFFPSVYRDASQPDNFVAYTHRGISYAAGGEVSGPINPFFDGVGRLPEAFVTVMPQELFPGYGLYYESDTRFDYLAQQWGLNHFGTNDFLEPDTVRISSYQKLTYPMHFWDNIVSFVPRAAYRYTYYEHLADGRTNETRSAIELGAETSFKAFADYGQYRHVVEPYLDYCLIPSLYNVKANQNYFFDAIDGPRDWTDLFGVNGLYAPRSWNGIRPGVRNDVQVREDDGSRRTIFDWDLFMACRFGGAGSGDTNGLRMVGWDATFTPYRRVKIQTTAYYDPKEHRMDMMDNSVTLGDPKNDALRFDWYRSQPVDPVTLNRPADPNLPDYNYLPSITLLNIEVTHRFNDIWAGNGYARYDSTERHLQEIGGYVQYDLDCLTFRLNAGVLPAFTRTDGTRRPMDYRVALYMDVKAFRKDNVEKLRAW
jgi:lipopolysaccharide assembly outer membrane protein LptD (OstA)